MVSYCPAVFPFVGITYEAPTLYKKPKIFIYGGLNYGKVFYLESCISVNFAFVKIPFLEIWSLILPCVFGHVLCFEMK